MGTEQNDAGVSLLPTYRPGWHGGMGAMIATVTRVEMVTAPDSMGRGGAFAAISDESPHDDEAVESVRRAITPHGMEGGHIAGFNYYLVAGRHDVVVLELERRRLHEPCSSCESVAGRVWLVVLRDTEQRREAQRQLAESLDSQVQAVAKYARQAADLRLGLTMPQYLLERADRLDGKLDAMTAGIEGIRERIEKLRALESS